MNKYIGEIVGIAIFIAFIGFIGFFMAYSWTQQTKCQELGGTYIKGNCLKVETIKL